MKIGWRGRKMISMNEKEKKYDIGQKRNKANFDWRVRVKAIVRMIVNLGNFG